MSRFFSDKLASLSPYVPGEQPREGETYVKLNTNESPFPPSPKATEEARSAANRVNLYSDPNARALKAAIAEYFGLTPSCVTVGNGSDECLAFAFAGLCPAGAVINDVTYGFYAVLAALFGTQTRVVPLKNDFTVDVEDYRGLTGTVFIANPNAPTGIALSIAEIEKLLAMDADRLVVVDEAYVDFGADSAVGLLGKYDNLIIVRTFSKSRSLAGARLGFTLSSPDLAADLERIRNSFNPYNVNAITQRMGAAAIEDEKYFDYSRSAIIENREYLADELKKAGFALTDSKANFLFAAPPDGNGERLYLELKARGVLVRYFDGERLRGRCRITVGSREQCETLVEAIKEIYETGE